MNVALKIPRMAQIPKISLNYEMKAKPSRYFIFCVVTYICLGFSVSSVGSRFQRQTSHELIHPAALFVLPYICSHVISTGASELRPKQTDQDFEDITPDQVEWMRNSISGESVEKSLRQIVPLASTTPPPNTNNVFSFRDKNEGTMISAFIDFISELASHNEWSEVYLIVPRTASRNASVVCNYLSFALLRTKVRVRCECGLESEMLSLLNSEATNEVQTERVKKAEEKKVFPIFSFYFMHVNTTSNSFGRAVHPQLLINYVKSRPIYVLGGNNTNKTRIIDQIQPEIQRNYKWTLVSYPELRSVSNSTEIILELDDIYGFGSTLDPLSVRLGNWSRARGLQIDPRNAFGPSDFQGRMLRITTVVGQPVVFIDTMASGKLEGRGYLPDIVEILSRQLNFTYEFMVPADKKFGSDEGNGSWSGMVGYLQRKEAEIAMMSFSLTTSRKSVMDFSPPVEFSSVRLLIRKDWQNAELKWSAYLQPLETDVWVAVPVCILLGVATLAFFARQRIFAITPGTSAWLLSSCFVLQGQEGHDSIKVMPYRLVIGTFWVLSLVVFACYTARLTSFLAATTENLPVKSLSEAVKLKSWKVGLVKGSAFLDRIKESRVDVLRSLSKRLSDDPSGLVDSFREGMDRVYKERFVFFTSELIPSYLVSGNCSYTWLPDRYYSGFGYMGYQKGLPYSAIISHKLAELRSTGQMRKLFLKWWGTESLCFLSNSGDHFLGMSLYETGTAFLILIFGVTFSFVLLLGEFYNRLRKSRAPTFEEGTTSSQNQNESMTSGYPFGDQSTHKEVGDLVRSRSTQNLGMHMDSLHGYYSYESEFTHSLQNKLKGNIFR